MVTLHYSLIRQITIGGISEKACYIIWFSVLLVSVGAGQWWFVPVGAVMHIGCVMLSQVDDFFFEIVLRAIKLPEYLE